jgi:hypothetical protein
VGNPSRIARPQRCKSGGFSSARRTREFIIAARRARPRLPGKRGKKEQLLRPEKSRRFVRFETLKNYPQLLWISL